jgi:transcriptional regulator with XRE-family HTH domain
MTLGETLKRARTEKGMSLRDVEKATNGKVSNGYLSLLENGEVKQPSPLYLHELARVYGIGYAELMMHAGYVAPEAVGSAGSGSGLAFSGAEDLTTEERRQVQNFIGFVRSQRGQRGKA